MSLETITEVFWPNGVETDVPRCLHGQSLYAPDGYPCWGVMFWGRSDGRDAYCPAKKMYHPREPCPRDEWLPAGDKTLIRNDIFCRTYTKSDGSFVEYPPGFHCFFRKIDAIDFGLNQYFQTHPPPCDTLVVVKCRARKPICMGTSRIWYWDAEKNVECKHFDASRVVDGKFRPAECLVSGEVKVVEHEPFPISSDEYTPFDEMKRLFFSCDDNVKRLFRRGGA